MTVILSVQAVYSKRFSPPKDWSGMMSRGVGVTETLRELLPPWAVSAAEMVTLIGDWPVIVILLALLYLASVWGNARYASASDRVQPLCPDRTAFMIATVFGGLSLTLFLKGAIGAPRPPAELHAVTPSEYGFPSGHTMTGTVFYGACAIWLDVWNRKTRFVGAGLLIFIVALSRLVLGVHFLADVTASVVIGSLYLAAVASTLEDFPGRTFGVAVVMALIALAVPGDSVQAALGVIGTVIAAVGWQFVEWEPVRTQIVHAIQSFEISTRQ